MVDEGKIEWETKFFDLFPELKDGANPAYYNITLQQLLSHRARLINFKDDAFQIIEEYELLLKEDLKLNERRYFLVKNILQKEPLPVYDECTDCYSNAGYIAAGMMLEKATGLTWEEMIINLSNDINLDLHIGFSVDNAPHQPRGHINPKDWNLDTDDNLVPISDQFKMYHSYNQFVLLTNPSGNLCISTKKLLEYLHLILDGLNGENNYLTSDTYNHIFKTYPKYSHGWWIDEIDGQIEYTHRGSNGTFYSFAEIFPEKNMGVV